jgi:hypothetical protein
VAAEVTYLVLEIAQFSEQAMKKDEGLTYPFFNKPELILLFDFVIHSS